jgi:hypothetical protein
MAAAIMEFGGGLPVAIATTGALIDECAEAAFNLDGCWVFRRATLPIALLLRGFLP